MQSSGKTQESSFSDQLDQACLTVEEHGKCNSSLELTSQDLSQYNPEEVQVPLPIQ